MATLIPGKDFFLITFNVFEVYFSGDNDCEL